MAVRAPLTTLCLAAVLVVACDDGDGGGEPTPAPDAGPACTRLECGFSCDDPGICGACGDGECAADESSETCPSDCCNPALCDPGGGAPWEAGDARCDGAPNGAACGDGDPATGWQACRGGRCLREHVHCRCLREGWEPDVAGVGELPEAPDDPPWPAPEPEEIAEGGGWWLRRLGVGHAWQVAERRTGARVGVVAAGCDGDGDGPWLASVIAGAADGEGVLGVAPGTEVVCVDAADLLGHATATSLAEGVDRAVEEGARVVLLGIAAVGPSATLEEAVARASEADVLVVAPAGPDAGASVDAFPAALDAIGGLVSVTATDRLDLPTSLAPLAPTTRLGAPGVGVAGELADGRVTLRHGAAPAAALVAGVAALVRKRSPGIKAPAVVALLAGTGAPVPLDGFDAAFSLRRVDAAAAVGAASNPAVFDAGAVVRIAAPSALPGQPLLASVTVRTLGAGDVGGVSLDATADGATVEPVGGPGPSAAEAAWTSLAWYRLTPEPGARALRLDVTVRAAGDVFPGNDRGGAGVRVTDAVHHEVRLVRASLSPDATDRMALVLTAEVENAGNVPEGPVTVSVRAAPGGEVASLDAPPLAAGQRAALTWRFVPSSARDGRHSVVVQVAPVRGQGRLADTGAVLHLRRGPDPGAALPAFSTAPAERIVADAPWRTVGPTVPVVVRAERDRWLAEADAPPLALVDRVLVYNPEAPVLSAGQLLVEAGPPDVPGVLAVDRTALNPGRRGEVPDPFRRFAWLGIDVRYAVVRAGRLLPARSRRMLGIGLSTPVAGPGDAGLLVDPSASAGTPDAALQALGLGRAVPLDPLAPAEHVWFGPPVRTLPPDPAEGPWDVNPFAEEGGWTADCEAEQAAITTREAQMRDYLDRVAQGLPSAADPAIPDKRFVLAGAGAEAGLGYAAPDEGGADGRALGRPGTWLLDDGPDALAAGRSAITSGPRVELQLDGEARGTWVDGAASWHEGDPAFEDPDGRMGGAGEDGGERTLLRPAGGVPAARLRCLNDEELGGTEPDSVSLYVARAGEVAVAPVEPPPPCDGAWHAVPFPAAAAAAPAAVSARVVLSAGCGRRWEAWTNPVWAIPAAAEAALRVEAADEDGRVHVVAAGDGPALRLRSALPLGKEDVVASLYLLDPDTGAAVPLDHGELVAAPADGLGVVAFALADPPPEGDALADAPSDERLVVAVRRTGEDPRLLDAAGNPLGVLLVRPEPR